MMRFVAAPLLVAAFAFAVGLFAGGWAWGIGAGLGVGCFALGLARINDPRRKRRGMRPEGIHEAAQVLLRTRDAIFTDYDQAYFARCLEEGCAIVDRLILKGSTRVLYFALPADEIGAAASWTHGYWNGRDV